MLYDAKLAVYGLDTFVERNLIGSRIFGLISEDTKERFRDGQEVITSAVIDVIKDEKIIFTKNSVYKLIDRETPTL